MAAAAAVLRADPQADLLIIERADDVGGTWRDIGCACDVPTSLYSFSFAPSAAWYDDRQCCQVQSALGDMTATVLVAATGALSTPSCPTRRD